jgi:hypothetical protein
MRIYKYLISALIEDYCSVVVNQYAIIKVQADSLGKD